MSTKRPMTAARWNRLATVSTLVHALPPTASERKLRLFVCAFWRAFHQQWAEGTIVTGADKNHMAKLLAACEAGEALADGGSVTPPISPEAWYATMANVRKAATEGGKGKDARRVGGAALLREVFGNPFRPVAFAPEWRTSTVMALAQGVYDDRAFDRLPILADALQDAGCDSDELLSHCRNEQAKHVRGCWAVDLVLGKG